MMPLLFLFFDVPGFNNFSFIRPDCIIKMGESLDTLSECHKDINTYLLNLVKVETRPVKYWMKAGGTNPSGETLNVNSLFWTRNDKPRTPVMGEFNMDMNGTNIASLWDEKVHGIPAKYAPKSPEEKNGMIRSVLPVSEYFIHID